MLTQENGKKLLGIATHIAPMTRLQSIFKGLDEQDVVNLETELNTEIPKVYVEFLRFSNGLHLFNTRLSFHGLRKNYDRMAEMNARNPFALSD